MGRVDEYKEALDGKEERKLIKVQIIEKFTKWIEENKKLVIGEATREDIYEWIGELEAEGKKRSTLNQYISIIRGFYGWWLETVPIPDGLDNLRRVCRMMKRFYRITQMEWILPFIE